MMNTKTTRITKRGVRHTSNCRRTLLRAATYSLTSSLIAPTLHATHCNAPKNGLDIGIYGLRSALPFIGDRYVPVRRQGDRRRHRRTQQSLVLTTRPGDTK